jgi:glycerol-3-phosphate O-acyltransferase
LRTDGAHRYIIEDDEFSDVAKVLRFVMNTMKMEYTLYLRFAPPLDPFGNPVDDDGASLDPRGRAIETERYLWQDGEVRPDPARDAEYTRACGQAVARAFRENTVVVSPAFVAFLVFRHLAAEYRDLDLYRLLRVARGETVPWTDLEPRAERLRQALVDLSRAGKIHLAPDVASRSVRELLDKGTGVLGTFHTTPVLTRRPEGIAVTQPNLLYFYSNRLAGYGLEGLS